MTRIDEVRVVVRTGRPGIVGGVKIGVEDADRLEYLYDHCLHSPELRDVFERAPVAQVVGFTHDHIHYEQAA